MKKSGISNVTRTFFIVTFNVSSLSHLGALIPKRSLCILKLISNLSLLAILGLSGAYGAYYIVVLLYIRVFDGVPL